MKRRVLLALFGVSWVLLFLWAFRPVRLWVFQTIVFLMGFSAGSDHAARHEFLDINDFRPVPVMRPVSANPVQKPKFDTIEFHGHIFGKVDQRLLAKLDRSRASYFVNLALRTTDLAGYRQLRKDYPSDRVLHFVGLNWKHAKKDPNFGMAMARELEPIAKEGARGIKLWKNLGLIARDPAGKLIALDDPRLDPVWDVCARYGLIVGIHTADPPAFFEEIDGRNERYGELERRPFWSFLSPGLPNFTEVLAQRDRLFARRRDVAFVALHFAELAHDLKRAGELLEAHPNVQIDIAQRIDELGRQPRAARAFLIKYSERILFGTDGPPDYEKTRIYWRFLETADEYFAYHPPHKPRKGLWRIYGLALPDPVLRRVYYENAARLLKLPR